MAYVGADDEYECVYVFSISERRGCNDFEFSITDACCRQFVLLNAYAMSTNLQTKFDRSNDFMMDWMLGLVP